MTEDELIQLALKNRERAYAIYSKFRVGAVLVTAENRLYHGCNIEISSYGLTICAERVAIFKAVSEGETKFTSIYIASDSEKITSPCGACRQVLWDLAGDIDVVMINRFGQFRQEKLSALLPMVFDKTSLPGKY
ncbi:MAG: cytidine deaminase [Candidatus Zhuqueibacterota bacterium]